MSRTLTPLIISNTFEDWLITTNDIIDVIEDVVTIGNAEINLGNIIIDGDISSTGTLKVNTIDVNSIGATRLTLSKPVNIDHDSNDAIILNRADDGSNEGAIGVKFNFEGTTKYSLSTNETHTAFAITNNPIGYSLRIEDDPAGTSGILIGDNLEISNTILPSQLTGNAESSTSWASSTKVQFSGDVSGEFDIQGGEASPIAVNLEVADDSHTHDSRYYTETESDQKYLPISGYAVKASGNFRLPEDSRLEWGSVGAAAGDASSTSLTGSSTTFKIETSRDTELFMKQKNFTIKSQLASGAVQTILSLNHSSGALQVKGDVTAKASLSDRRKKENIEKLENALDKVEMLNGYTFNYIGDKDRMTGVMADEVKEVLPEVVYEVKEENDTFDAVRYGNMMGLMIEAIKELRREIEEIKRG